MTRDTENKTLIALHWVATLLPMPMPTANVEGERKHLLPRSKCGQKKKFGGCYNGTVAGRSEMY